MKKENGFVLLFIRLFVVVIAIFIFLLSVIMAKVEVNTEISKYNDYIGANAKEEYRKKWGMDEEIFPKMITKNMHVKDYKMVYYNPWDAQYLSYIVISYNDQDYKKEVERLEKYESTEYKGYYGVTGFSKYKLLAMYADSYSGFVYAITDNKDTIIYVELIFCNYCYDLDYKEYINKDYLPDGFDARDDNEYQKEMFYKH